jgi:phage-related protein (TIGR01555 family)
LTGLGDALRDKLQSTRFERSARLNDTLLEALYHDEDMAARIVEALPEDALRRGYSLSIEGDEESELPGEAFEYEKRIGFRRALREAAVWARCFGGAVVYLGIDDGADEAQPVNEGAIKTVRFATVLTKRELTPSTYYDDPRKANFGEPELYELAHLTTPGGLAQELAPGMRIHETRVLRLDGARTSLTRRQRNQGWSDSVLQKVHAVLVQFNVGWQGTAHLLQDAAQGVFKMEGLIDMLTAGEKEALAARMELVDMSRSVARAVLLDAEKEEFSRDAPQLSGVPDTLRSFMLRLAAAARMPVTVLMGQSPAGLNATGESDTRMWYDRVEGYQEESLLPVVERFYRLMFLAADFSADEPDSWEVRFEKLWQLSDKEQAELEKLVAERDKVYIDAQVLLPEEVALNRFKAGGFSSETQIDIDARKEMLAAELELAKEKAGEDPLDAVDPTGAPGAPGAVPGGRPAPAAPKPAR